MSARFSQPLGLCALLGRQLAVLVVDLLEEVLSLSDQVVTSCQ